MKKTEIIYGSVLTGIAVSILDFSLFFKNAETAFIIHNILSIIVGLLLLVFGWRLVKAGNSKTIHSVAFIVGVFIVAVHITKLIIGKIF